MALEEKKSFSIFRTVDHIREDVDIKNKNGKKKNISIIYEVGFFFLDGKIIMETFQNILTYFEKNIHAQKKEYPIAECVKISIVG